MSHYYDFDENLDSKPRYIKFNVGNNAITLKTDIGVFSKSKIDDGSLIFLKAIQTEDFGNTLLDMGSGYGAIGLTIALLNPHIELTCADVNTRALSLCKENAKKLSLSSRVTCLQSDVYQNIEGLYDSIVSNPPIRAGKKVTYAIYSGAKDHLIDGGSLYIVVNKAQGALSVKKYLIEIFNNVTLIDRDKGFHVYKATKVN